jgi:hypothetical protein
MPSTVLDFDASAPDISADRRHCAALVAIERDLRVPFLTKKSVLLSGQWRTERR